MWTNLTRRNVVEGSDGGDAILVEGSEGGDVEEEVASVEDKDLTQKIFKWKNLTGRTVGEGSDGGLIWEESDRGNG